MWLGSRLLAQQTYRHSLILNSTLPQRTRESQLGAISAVLLQNLVETKPSFLEAYIAMVADDKVVEHLDVEELARFHNLLRYLDILGTGGWVS